MLAQGKFTLRTYWRWVPWPILPSPRLWSSSKHIHYFAWWTTLNRHDTTSNKRCILLDQLANTQNSLTPTLRLVRNVYTNSPLFKNFSYSSQYPFYRFMLILNVIFRNGWVYLGTIFSYYYFCLIVYLLLLTPIGGVLLAIHIFESNIHVFNQVKKMWILRNRLDVNVCVTKIKIEN